MTPISPPLVSITPHIVLPVRAAAPGNIPGVAFKPARYFRWWTRKFADVMKGNVWIVIHAAECAETLLAAEALQNYASTMTDGRIASWTYACDANSTTQSVLERYVAFHAPPLNDYSIGIELAGYSNQLSSGWSDDYSKKMIDSQLVPLIANICKRVAIPVRTVPDDLLKNGLANCNQQHRYAEVLPVYGGIVTHAQVSRVFKQSNHVDPGPAFPLEDVVVKVVAQMAA